MQIELDYQPANIGDRIFYIIKMSSHKDDPIMSREIEYRIGLSGSEIRKIIKELRREGKPIANCNKGYYIAETYEDYESTIKNLYNRSMSMLVTLKAMRKAFNKDFQYTLGEL